MIVFNRPALANLRLVSVSWSVDITGDEQKKEGRP
jgi:hypothetical protein